MASVSSSVSQFRFSELERPRHSALEDVVAVVSQINVNALGNEAQWLG